MQSFSDDHLDSNILGVYLIFSERKGAIDLTSQKDVLINEILKRW